MKQYKIAVVGATGMVGRMFLRVLEERKLPASEYFLFASARSAGTTVDFMGKKHTVRELTEDAFKDLGVDIALFSCGAGVFIDSLPDVYAEFLNAQACLTGNTDATSILVVNITKVP